jgi:2-(1,2-epoxy-1,2-dihydrophenyl)acetyl-CoA isomerase
MSDFETVTVERRGMVGVITLNRPDVLNAFNAILCRELLSAVEEVNADQDIRVVILTGAGRAFSAGADLGEIQGPGGNVIDTLNNAYKPILMAITNAPKPWVSAVNGAAAGIGSAFAMCCDLTVMAENGYIYQAFSAIGLIPDGGATWHLVNTLGRKRAYEMIVSGEKVAAQKCLDLGLCNRVVPTDSLIDEAMSWAEELATKAPLSLRYAKKALNDAMNNSVGDTISNEAELQHLCITSEDAREGVAAFMQKRSAQWKGR